MPVSCSIQVSRGRNAFSLIEVAITLALVGLIVTIALPKSTVAMARARVQRASSVVAGDFDLALSLSARQHRPLRLSIIGTKYVITGRANDTVLVRSLGSDSDFYLSSVIFSPNQPVDLFPTGLASGSLAIILMKDGFQRTVTMTRAGQVRITTP